MLCECGFNQCLFEGDCKTTELQAAVREIARFSTLPQVTVSSAWDTSHVCVETIEEGRGGEGAKRDEERGSPLREKKHTMTLTRGRWQPSLSQVKGDEKVMEVMEVAGQMVVKMTDNTLLAVDREGEIQSLTTSQHSVEKLYSVGGCGYAKLSHGPVYVCTLTSNTLNLTTPLLAGVTMTQLACGSDHILLLSDTGRVWSNGLNHRGQLGHGDILPRPHPSLIEALDGIHFVAVACGNWHNLALSEYGDVYSWGWNVDQQLGHSADSATVATPMLVDVKGEVDFKTVQCGARHSAALSVQGVLYAWGWNKYQQLCPQGTTTGPQGSTTQGLSPVTTRGEVCWVHCCPWSTMFITNHN